MEQIGIYEVGTVLDTVTSAKEQQGTEYYSEVIEKELPGREIYAVAGHCLGENLKSIDLYALNTVVSCLSLKDYGYAKELLTGINKQLEYQSVMPAFYFASSKPSKEEQAFLDITRQMQLKYSSLIKDLLYYIPLAESVNDGHALSYEEVIDYTMTQYDYLHEQYNPQHSMSRTLCSQVLELPTESDIGQELQRLIDIRLTMRTNLYQLKAALAKESRQVIDYEEERIRRVLTTDS